MSTHPTEQRPEVREQREKELQADKLVGIVAQHGMDSIAAALEMSDPREIIDALCRRVLAMEKRIEAVAPRVEVGPKPLREWWWSQYHCGCRLEGWDCPPHDCPKHRTGFSLRGTEWRTSPKVQP